MRTAIKQMVLGGVLFATGFTANAALMVQITDGTNTFNAIDNVENDFDFMPFILNKVTEGYLFTGTPMGSFDGNTVTGTASPYLGDARTYEMDLNSVNTSNAAGSITIKLTQTDIDASDDTGFSIDLGGTTDGMISFQSYVDSTNAAFGEEALLYDTGILENAYSASYFAGGHTLLSPYSLTIVATITHTAGGQVSSFDYNIKVPEPTTIALLGGGLLLLGFSIGSRRVM